MNNMHRQRTLKNILLIAIILVSFHEIFRYGISAPGSDHRVEQYKYCEITAI